MEAEARVFVLVQRGTVEARQRPVILGEMRRHPVEDHADTRLVAAIDKMAQLVRRAEAAGRRKIAGGLVAPRFVQRVLGDRQQLDMRVTHALDVGHKVGGQFAVGVEAPVGMALPRTGMHFIDIDRPMQPVPLRALFHPFVVLPAMPVGQGGEGGRAGAMFVTLRIGVGLGQYLPGVTVADLVAVQRVLLNLGNEQFPHAAGTVRAHRMHAAIPAVEFAHHADTLGIRCPEGESDALHAIDFNRMRTEHPVALAQLAFAEQVQILRRNMRRKLVGIVDFTGRAAIVHTQAVRAGRFVVAAPFKYPGGVDALERGALGIVEQVNIGGVRFVYPDNPLRTFTMQAEQAEWVMETSLQQRFDWPIHLSHRCPCLVGRL